MISSLGRFKEHGVVWLVLAASLAWSENVHPQATGGGFLDRIYTDAAGERHRYVVFVPDGYEASHQFPLILFLHGKGECGTDGIRQTQVGLGPAIRRQIHSFPFIVVFPQSEQGNWWPETPDARRALAILDEVKSQYSVDPERLYLTGISLGGFGAWWLAEAYPEMWAAIVPICGGGNPKEAAKIKDIPCWCFHGGQDRSVPVSASRLMVEALRRVGSNPKYTEYSGVGHNSWNKAYAEKELFSWLSAQHRK
jgi:predicted peptidase